MEKNTKKKYVIGVGISFENTVCAIVDLRGNVIAIDDFTTSDYPDIDDYVSKLSECIVSLAESYVGIEKIRSVGISAPSGNRLTGCITNSPNFPWKGVIPLEAMLRDRLGIAVALGNDAHSNALGEYIYGTAHGMKNFIVVTLGTGLGSCVFTNGFANLGQDGFAGEIGHTCIIPDGRPCGCGNRGCLETYTAAKGIVMTAKEIMQETDEPSLMRQAEELTPRIIVDFCNQGDQLAIDTFNRTGKLLGLGLANYASALNPEAIILTGGITKAGKWLYDPTYRSFKEHIFPNMRDMVKLIVSDLDGHERVALGASSLAWETEEYSLFK
jgi:glucokinase